MTAPKPTILDQFGRPAANAFFYDGVQHTRERRWLPAVAADSSQTLTSATRTQLLALARYLVANVGLVRGAIRDMATYSVGSGLTPASLVADEKIGDAYEQYFDWWGGHADLTGKHTFCQIQNLACQAIDVDGDIGLVMHSPGPKALGKLQIIEGHRITSETAYSGQKLEGYNDGVKQDGVGSPLSYRVKEGLKEYRDIPASEFIFLYEPERLDQVRGYTSLIHAIAHVRDIIDILGYEKIGVKMASAIGLAIKTHGGTADPGSSFIESGFKAIDTGGLPWETFQAGMIPRLRVGEDIASFGSNRPGEAFMRLLEFLIRDVAVGLGLPFEFVWDLAAAKGSGSRFILAKAQRRFAQRQALLISRLLTRVWRWVIAKGIHRKDIPSVDGWWNVRWQAPPQITVDMGREAQANRDDLKYGNRTLQMDAAEQGLDWKTDIREQRDRESDDLIERAVRKVQKYGKDGLTLDKALFLLSADGPNAPQLEVIQKAA